MKFLQGLVLFKILSIEPIYFMFLRDLVSSKTIVIPTIIFTLEREEVLILCITNKPKLLVLFHGILVYTRNSVYIFQIPGGKYINVIFSDGTGRNAVSVSAMNHDVLTESLKNMTC